MNKIADRKWKMGAAQSEAAIGLGAPAVQHRCCVLIPLAGLYPGKDARVVGAQETGKNTNSAQNPRQIKDDSHWDSAFTS